MMLNKRALATATAVCVSAVVQPVVAQTAPTQNTLPVAKGPFSAAAGSLKQYKAPAWFRDAKFGIWSHWGPQAVPRQGDWYARNMYRQGERQYRHHVATYGHPSKFGYKDIIPLWKAEKFDPNVLMSLYAKAGARYFVSMGVHHDNFDLWNSKHHRWNAVRMGPKRDIVGEWKKAAQRHGLRFGVSEHLGASYTWFQGSHGADRTGPLAGVPYDGADPKYQDLYHAPAAPGDRGWYTNNPAWQRNWYRRIQDLVDTYRPDLLYSDGGIPFGEVGRSMIAHFYNSNMRWHGGRLEAVYNYKNIGSGEFIEGAGILDVERGGLQGINPLPWQTDTSIGDWYYREGERYKSTSQVIHSLADIVSKNGNMLLNVVQYPDGSLPPEPQRFLTEMAAWMPVNGEAIYGTRPWTIFGEGPTRVRAGNFSENFPFSPRDIRFTTKGGALYAITLGVPTEPVVIKALATGSPLVTGNPTEVKLLGHNGNLRWTRTAEGLIIQLPAQLPTNHAISFRIRGLRTVPNVDAAQLAELAQRLTGGQTRTPADRTVEAAADGSFALLPAKATLHGNGIQAQGEGNDTNIGYWDNAQDWVSWDIVKVTQPGIYRVSAEVATIHESSDFVVEVAGTKLPGKALTTGDWNTFRTIELGQVEINQPGNVAVSFRPTAATWRALNLRAIRLTRVTG